jgi:acetyl esterase/lipase
MALKSYVTLFFAAVFSLSAQTADVLFPKVLDDGKSGKHEIQARGESFRFAGADGVRALLFIPATVKPAELAAAPIVVFYHGNSKDKTLYKSAGNVLHKYASDKKFLVLSVQNWWPLSGNMVEAAEDSRQATNLILTRLAEKKVGDTNQVFVTGFSAGGLTALLTFVQSIDGSVPGDRNKMFFNYAGMASFKGNFYGQYFMPNPMLSPDQRKTEYARLTQGKAVILTVGGKKDAPRVQQQQPEAKQFLEGQLGITVTYQEFPNQGHSLDKDNLELLWRAMGR